MPPKTPAKNPSETAPETAGVFGYAAELAARIEKEGADSVYVRVTRDVEGQAEPEFLHDYPGPAWNLDTMRADFGQGRYTCTIMRRAGHGYVIRRSIAVGPAPRSLPAPATTPTPAPAPAAPMMLQGPNGMPMPTDPMSMMLMMHMENARQAREDARRSDERSSRLMEAIVSRTQGDPLDQLSKLAPLIQRESTSTEALKLADQLARRYRGEERDRGSNDEDDEESPLAMLGAVLAPIVQRLMAGGIPAARPAPAAPAAPRHVPNTAQQPNTPSVQQAGSVSAHAPAPSGGLGAGAVGAPTAPATPTDEDDEDTGPEGYTYTPEELGTIDAAETDCEALGMHPCIGSMAGVLKLRHAQANGPFPNAVAQEVIAWFKWWQEGAAEDLKSATNGTEYEAARQNAAQIYEAVQLVVANCAQLVDTGESAALNMLAAQAGVPVDYCQAVARELDAIARPAPAPTPAPTPTPTPTPETPTPTPAPAKPARRRPRTNG